MNKLFGAVLVATSFIGVASVQANDELYLGITGGGSVNGDDLFNGNVTRDPGYFNLSIKGGYLFDLGPVLVGPELEYTHFFSDSVYNQGTVNLQGNDYLGRVMGNAVVKLDTDFILRPYGFVGVGGMFDDRFVGVDNNEAIWQIGAGVNVPVTDNLSLDGGYRFVQPFDGALLQDSHELYAGFRLNW